VNHYPSPPSSNPNSSSQPLQLTCLLTLGNSVFTNNTTGGKINYYEIDIKPVEKQIYPLPFKKARFVGYDGLVPGPTFVQERGEEAIVRFINHGDRASSIHLHGSYSRAPFDGYADDTTAVGEYKDYYYPNGQNARTLWYHVSLL